MFYIIISSCCMVFQDEEIQELTKRNDELDKQISALQTHIEKQKNILNRCLELNKTLLIDKVCIIMSLKD